MTERRIDADAVVIGGGFYGSAIAIYLAKTRGLSRVLLVEREPALLRRASYNNQARVHNGYHYPRSFTTAFRSRVNLPRFARDWPQVMKQDFVKLYAIARRNSKVTAKQFERFCDEIGAKVKPAEAGLKRLFEPRLIENVFLVEEYAFDSTRLARWAVDELKDAGVYVHYSTLATSISRSSRSQGLVVGLESKSEGVTSITCRYVFNCTYSGLNQFSGDFSGIQSGLKQEVAEMALMQVPDDLKNIGVTVMDGPFFSMMPFPDRRLHTLSHVRYTPHFSWRDEQGVDPYKVLHDYNCETRVDRMIRDVGRYLPSLLKAKYIDSLFV
ncbi:MAG TPA: D amino acid oxidase (DAO) family protein, partial [Methylophaga sp.]|nr:D amino acid oxidase (DAO) family protein [Methylophaga sp.]